MKSFMVYTKKGEFVCAVAALTAIVALGIAAKFKLLGYDIEWDYEIGELN